MDTTRATSESFEQLYARYAPMMARRISYLLRESPDLIPDTVQEAAIKLWDAFTRTGRIMASYAYKIATTTAYDALRVRQREQEKMCSLEATWHPFEDQPGHDQEVSLLPLLADEEADPARIVEQRTTPYSEETKALLTWITPREWEVLRVRAKAGDGWYGNISCKATAKQLGITPGALRSRIHHMRERLRARLEESAIA